MRVHGGVASRAHQGQLRLLLAVVLGSVAGLSVSGIATHVGLDPIGAAALEGILRGALAGSIAGLTCERTLPALAAFAGAAASVVAVGLTAATGTDRGLVLLVASLVTVATATCFAAIFAWFSRWWGESIAGLAALGLVLAAAVVYAGRTSELIGDPSSDLRFAELSVQPAPEGYEFDGSIYLRVRDLMIQGQPYYAAFRQAIIDDGRSDASFIVSPFNVREPLLFEVWRVLPGSMPHHLLAWFIVLGLIAMVCAYRLSATFVAPGPALLAPVLLLPYLYWFWWQGTWFTMAEIWAALAGIVALMFLVRRRWVLSVIFLVSAVATREFMILLIPAWLAAWWFGCPDAGERARRWWMPASAAVLPAILLGVHLVFAAQLTVPSSSPGLGISRWLQGSPGRLASALGFAWDYVPLKLPLVAVLYVAAICGALLLPRVWQRVSLLLVVLLPLTFLLFLSGGQWSDYWGAFLAPLAISIAPSVVGPWIPAPSNAVWVLANEWGRPKPE